MSRCPPLLALAVLGAAALAGAVPARADDGAVDVDMARLEAKADGFRPLIREVAARHGVRPELVEALAAIESAFRPEAVSRVGAIGLMQVMPATAARLGVEDPFDLRSNLEAGTRFLAALLSAFDGDERLAVAAYNAGEGAVRRAGGVPGIPETRRHVTKVDRYLRHVAGRGLNGEEGPGAGAPIVLRPSPPPVLRSEPSTMVIVRDANGRVVFTNAPEATRRRARDDRRGRR